jgi:hypothetical protein
MSPAWIQAYKSAHARSTFHVVSQEITVSDAQAEQVLNLVMANGQVPGAYCANATSSLLQKVQGFEELGKTFYPVKLSENFASLPNVTTTKYYEDDDGDVIDAVRAKQLVQYPQQCIKRRCTADDCEQNDFRDDAHCQRHNGCRQS